MKIPIIDLKRQYAALKPDILRAIERVIDSGNFILGEELSSFEAAMADYLGVTTTIGVSNGTDALWVALKAMGVTAQDRVITSPFTFFATVSAIMGVGATPVFADIDPETYQLDPNKVEEQLARDPHIKAILPVHLYGQSLPIDDFLWLAKRYDVALIEDAAQAIGTTYHDKKVGGFGHLTCFSFFPTKNLGALGEGGMVSTNHSDLAEKVRLIRTHGSVEKYHHKMLGSNCRFDAIQAATLKVFLPHLEGWIATRRKAAEYYTQELSQYCDILALPAEIPGVRHTYHQYTIRVRDNHNHRGLSNPEHDKCENLRNNFQSFLTQHDVSSGVYYPIPCHLQEALAFLGHKPGSFPVAEKITTEVISLPIFPGLTTDELSYVVEIIKKWVLQTPRN